MQSDDATEPWGDRAPGSVVEEHLRFGRVVASGVVGCGHVSLWTNSDTWHSKLVRNIGYVTQAQRPRICSGICSEVDERWYIRRVSCVRVGDTNQNKNEHKATMRPSPESTPMPRSTSARTTAAFGLSPCASVPS